MKKTNKFEITNDDYNLLRILWRWKLLTTTQIHGAVFKDRTVEKCYRRLCKLEREKYIESVCSLDRKSTIWQITLKGFKCLDFGGKEFDQLVLKAESLDHDYWVTSIQIGSRLVSPNSGPLFCTEQELRSLKVSSFPDWVPQTKLHRPDGWWKTDLAKPNSHSLVALEVELSKKTPLSYSETGSFYHQAIDVYQVIWFVKSVSDMNYIKKHLANGNEEAIKCHSFLLLDQFIKDQYQSKVIFGKNVGLPLSSVLSLAITEGRSLASQQWILDLRKYPVKSNRIKIPQSSEIRLNRYGNKLLRSI